jgi:hypothetical protein
MVMVKAKGTGVRWHVQTNLFSYLFLAINYGVSSKSNVQKYDGIFYCA